MTVQRYYACVWLDDQAEQAANFYVDAFPDASILSVQRYHGAEIAQVTGKPDGSVMTVNVDLHGQRLMLLNGGPMFAPNEGMSLVVTCDTQDEIDRLWDRLTADGGSPSQCGWLTDKFGVSWQLVPAEMDELFDANNAEALARVTQAMLTMGKLDIAALHAAYRGN